MISGLWTLDITMSVTEPDCEHQEVKLDLDLPVKKKNTFWGCMHLYSSTVTQRPFKLFFETYGRGTLVQYTKKL
jgi:hypothetical protein